MFFGDSNVGMVEWSDDAELKVDGSDDIQGADGHDGYLDSALQ